MKEKRPELLTGPIPVDTGFRRSIRRRMVQSTLLHQKAITEESDSSKNEKRKCPNSNDEAIDEGDDEYFGGIQSRKKLKRKGSSKKSRKIANEISPSTENRNDNSTIAQDEKITYSLMLEAKLTAEENLKRFAGKQIHPFFTSMNAEKRNQDSSSLHNNIFAHREICQFDTVGPVHVFEKEQDGEISIDWNGWKFLDQSLHGEAFNVLPHCADYKESLSKIISVSEAVNLNGSSKKKNDRIHVCNNVEPYKLDKELWSEKYQPRKAVDVCGNVESVKYLSEWLQSWHSPQSTTTSPRNDGVIKDNESDYEDMNNDTARKNVLLITGAVGSGKSAAIYACAKEQGFKILEINASDIRSGLVVKQKFGEALESQFLEWSQEDPPEIIDTVSYKLKPLILFEDVDIVFPEDKGLTYAIKDIADKAKGPVILTSNSARPSLPDNLERSEIFFTLPTLKDLLDTLQTVCAAEEAEVDGSTLERITLKSKGDIRKAVMELQFWCLGIHLTKDALFKAPFSCGLESAHRMLPKIVRWSFPSPLSQHIDDQLTKCLASLDDESSQIPSVQSAIDAKKDAMLVLSCPEMEYADFPSPEHHSSGFFSSEFSKKSRRNRHVVLSYSDDEIVSLTDSSFGKMGTFKTCDSRFESRNGDVSCVPGSTFVAESESNDGTQSEEDNTPPGDYGFVGGEVGQPGTSPEEVEDSQCVRVGSVRPEIQWLDQCSRVDFTAKMVDVTSACSSVGDRWGKLIGCCGEMKSLLALEPNDVSRIVALTSRLSDFISDVEQLHNSDETAAFWETGLHFYSDKSNLDFDLRELTCSCEHVVEGTSNKTKGEVLKCVVPSRFSMCLNGGALYDYLSSLRCILRTESQRANGLLPRKSRGKRHYLRSFLSIEEISELDKCNHHLGGKL